MFMVIGKDAMVIIMYIILLSRDGYNDVTIIITMTSLQA